MVHFGQPELTALAGAFDDPAGEVELFAVLRQEFGGRDENRAGQAGVGMRAALLQRQPAVAIGQGLSGLGEVVLCPFGVGEWAVDGEAEALLPEVAEVLSTVGLQLSPEKTLITHIDEGLDILGWRIQRHRKRGTTKHFVYNYPAKKALRSIKAKTKAICRMNLSLSLAVLLHKLNQALRGWTAYFRPGVSARAFQYLRMIVWRQVFGWLRRKYPNAEIWART